jgi:hypothetical protein
MITELNSIRGGKSFTDPEVYGKLVTFFKNLSDEQKADLKVLLVQIAELVTSVEEGSQNQSQPQDHNAAPPQMNNAQPPASAPQSSAPMPGAQASAGAAGVGVA